MLVFLTHVNMTQAIGCVAALMLVTWAQRTRPNGAEHGHAALLSHQVTQQASPSVSAPPQLHRCTPSAKSLPSILPCTTLAGFPLEDPRVLMLKLIITARSCSRW